MADNYVMKFSHVNEHEESIKTQHRQDMQREKEELAKYKHFFKRKGINPQILYNTLTLMTPLFHHREEEWETFLKLVIKENKHKRPNYSNVQYWFLDSFQTSLNVSEAKYFCRYVKMSSVADDSETKLRNSMDNIDLPPIKYDNWVSALYTLEGDDELDDVNFKKNIIKARETFAPPTKKQNYFQFALTKVADVVGNILPKEKFSFHKTYPSHKARIPSSGNDDEKLLLSNRGARRSRTRCSDPSISITDRGKSGSLTSIETTLETEGGDINDVSSFSSRASTAFEDERAEDFARVSRRYRSKDNRVMTVCEDAE
mmetsp:Transcript_852/g.1484  ORF Transcript_852/g.1484 Transcript_852/m.1484 type:complete len:315 (-) Transcript_852:212-1156(-)